MSKPYKPWEDDYNEFFDRYNVEDDMEEFMEK